MRHHRQRLAKTAPMAADDPNYPMPPSERLFAPEELRPLEEFPKPLTEPLRERPDLQDHLTAIRKHFLELEEQAAERLTPYLDGTPIGSPDHMEKIEEWRTAINRGEVPAEFGKVKLLQAREILADHFYYGELLGLVRLVLERGLWRALPGAGLAGAGSEESAPPARSRADGEQVDLEPTEFRRVLRLAEAAEDMGRALQDLLGALELVLGLLVSMNPADLIRGRGTVVNARGAGSSPKYARGVQAGVDHAYRPGMKEQECQDALLTLLGQGFETEDGRYELYLDSDEDKGVAIVQRDLDTGRERSLQCGSLYPYFVRARDAQSP